MQSDLPPEVDGGNNAHVRWLFPGSGQVRGIWYVLDTQPPV